MAKARHDLSNHTRASRSSFGHSCQSRSVTFRVAQVPGNAPEQARPIEAVPEGVMSGAPGVTGDRKPVMGWLSVARVSGGQKPGRDGQKPVTHGAGVRPPVGLGRPSLVVVKTPIPGATQAEYHDFGERPLVPIPEAHTCTERATYLLTTKPFKTSRESGSGSYWLKGSK